MSACFYPPLASIPCDFATGYRRLPGFRPGDNPEVISSPVGLVPTNALVFRNIVSTPSQKLAHEPNAPLDISLFIRLLCHRRLLRRCHEFTHCIHENGTARNYEPLGLIRPDFDSVLWLSRNAQALSLLPATTTLRQQTDSLPGRRKPDQPPSPSAIRKRTRR
jgi:hypothetical protein